MKNYYNILPLYALLFFLFLSWNPLFCAQKQTAGINKIIVIPAAGTADASMASLTGGSICKSFDGVKTLIIPEMDTLDYSIDAALQIIDTLLSVPEDKSITHVINSTIPGCKNAFTLSEILTKPVTLRDDCLCCI